MLALASAVMLTQTGPFAQLTQHTPFLPFAGSWPSAATLHATSISPSPSPAPGKPSSIFGYLTDVEALLTALGPWVLAAVLLMVFIESGVLFPFLPGDSLIFTTGLLHQQLGLDLWILLLLIPLAAFLGDQVGYVLGRRFGRRFFKPDARILKTEYLAEAEAFFHKYGGRSLVLARFVPFVRTFTPLAAGLARYHYPKFLTWNAVGAIGWGAGLTAAGSALGGVAFIRNNIEALALVIVAVSLLPMIIELANKRRKAKAKGQAEAEADG